VFSYSVFFSGIFLSPVFFSLLLFFFIPGYLFSGIFPLACCFTSFWYLSFEGHELAWYIDQAWQIELA